MNLSVIIVNYNVKHFLEQCLVSVEKALEKIDSEIIIVDNNSVDGSINLIKEKFSFVKLIANKTNTGFAVANNQALKIARGKYVLLLNPDTIVQEDTFSKCLEFMENNQNAGALGVKMFDGNGKFLPESKRGLPTPGVAFCKIFGLSTLFPKSKYFGKYHLGFLSKNKIHQVDILSGAFMLIRKQVIDKVGLLDEAFFMYGEDIDFSYRIIKAGYKNYYFSETNIIHYKGESTKKSSINYVFVFYKAMIIFAEKHFTKKNIKTFSFLINIAIYFRASIAVLQRIIKRWSLSIIDFLLFTGLIYGFSIFYQDFSEVMFPFEKVKIIIPVYALIWTISNRTFGIHQPPFKIVNILKSNAAGLIFLLACYALIPKSIQFSRAVILGSSLITLFVSYLTRYSFHIFKIGLFQNQINKNKTIAIVGSKEEFDRIQNLMLSNHNIIKKVYKICPNKNLSLEMKFDGNINQLNEIISVNKVDEVIFCAKDISAQNIIYSMAYVNTKKNISFKILPEKSQIIIGSKSIYNDENYYTTELKNINSSENIRKKRSFDIYTCLILLFTFPFIIVFSRKYPIIFKELWHVIYGSKTWIGYQNTLQSTNLPKIKPCVFSVVNKADQNKPEISNKVNIIYAKDYSLILDLNLILRRIFKS